MRGKASQKTSQDAKKEVDFRPAPTHFPASVYLITYPGHEKNPAKRQGLYLPRYAALCKRRFLTRRLPLLLVVLFRTHRFLDQVDHLPDGPEVDGLVLVHPGDTALPGAVLALLDADDEGAKVAVLFQ